jgi:hypothetical protein
MSFYNWVATPAARHDIFDQIIIKQDWNGFIF